MVSYGFYWLVERMHWALLEGSEGKISIKHCPRTKRDRNPNKNWLKAVWKGLKGEICCIKCKLCWYRFADLSSFWFHGSRAGGLARGGLNIYVYICIFYLILLSSQFSVSLVAKQYVQFASGTGGCIFVRGHSLRFVCKGQAYALFAKNLFWNSIMQYLTWPVACCEAQWRTILGYRQELALASVLSAHMGSVQLFHSLCYICLQFVMQSCQFLLLSWSLCDQAD